MFRLSKMNITAPFVLDKVLQPIFSPPFSVYHSCFSGISNRELVVLVAHRPESVMGCISNLATIPSNEASCQYLLRIGRSAHQSDG